MSVRNVKLNYIGTGKNMKMFSLAVSEDGENYENRVYYGDIEENASMTDSQKNNKYNMYNFTHGHVISNLYDSSRVRHRSQVLKYNKSSANDNIDDYATVFVPDEGFGIDGFTQNSDSVYTLNKETRKDFRYERYDFDTHKVVESDGDIHTYLYRPVQQDLSNFIQGQSMYVRDFLSAHDFQEDAYLSVLNKVFQPYADLSGVNYNYVMEIPQSYKYTYYDSNSVLANSFNTKNALNYMYSMSFLKNKGVTSCDVYENDDYISSFSTTGSQMTLHGTRNYFEINTCGGQTYLKYYDNNKYDTYMLSDFYESIDYENEVPRVLPLNMEKGTYGDFNTYQKVETIGSLNRFQYTNHKSNMYSVEIRDSGINKVEISEDVRKNIKQDVENSIRLMTKKLCPANTELLKIYWTGE